MSCRCVCKKRFKNVKIFKAHLKESGHPRPKWMLERKQKDNLVDLECEICGSRPVLPETGMCPPCSTGDSAP